MIVGAYKNAIRLAGRITPGAVHRLARSGYLQMKKYARAIEAFKQLACLSG